MTHDRFSFEGLTAIEKRLVRLADEVDYIVIQDRTGSKKDETLGRFDFNAHCALPYLEDEHDDPSEDDESPFDDTWDDEPDDDGPEITRKQIAEAACLWIRDIAQRCCIGERYIRFRIKAWGPKAFRMVDSGQFVCRNHGFDLDLPVDADEPVGPPMPEPDFDKAALRGAAKGIQALGEYYAQWGNIVLGSVGQLQGINNQMSTRLHRQLQESRDQVDTLVASILDYRFQEATAAETRKADERDSDTRAALARDAIHQVGEAAKALLSANGLTPEMAEVVHSLGQSPALVDALRDPAVRALMREPSNLDQLALMLKQAAAAAQAQGQPTPPAS